MNFIPGPSNTWTLQVDLSGDLMVTALEQIFPNFGGDPGTRFEDGIYLWDIADPVQPRLVGHYRTGGTGTHRNHYPGGRYVHVAAGLSGYRGNIYVIVDISDPAAPFEAGRWWVPGQHPDDGVLDTPALGPRDGHHGAPSPCCSAGHDVSLHGPAYLEGSLAYLPYGAAGMIILDISNVSRPRQVGQLSFSPPFHSRFGVHGVLPIPERGIAFVNSEHTTYAEGAAHHASIVDIRDPANPYLLSLFPEPEPPAAAPYSDFASRGGWRGPHNINHHQHHPDVERQGDLFYIAHFNAGLRIYDVANRHLVREVGYFIPPDPVKRYGPMPEGRLVAQTEDVVVDSRGYIYITDKNQGMWVLRYSGPR
ncbi:LVIVD repeat-containing protein [Nocardia sp. NPDC003963]